MKISTKSSSAQHFNYSRIPNWVVETSALNVSEKKVLHFLFLIHVHEHIPIGNVVKGWKSDKTLAANAPMPSQLRKIVNTLESKGYIEKIITNKKLTALRIKIENDHISASNYFLMSKEISSNQFLTLDNMLNLAAYTRFHHTNVIYSTKLAAVLGVTAKTFRRNNERLIKLKLLEAEKSKKSVYSNNHSIITYRMNASLYIHNHSKKTVKGSFHTQRDDFYPLKIYFLKKIKNNVTMQGILKMERKNTSKPISDFLEFSMQDECINALQARLMQSGKFIEKEDLKRRTIEIILKKSNNDKLRFLDTRSFYSFMISTLNPKDQFFNFNPSTFEFITELKKHLPFCLPELILNQEIKDALDQGIQFKDCNHALRFFVTRISRKTFSSHIREEGIREKIGNQTTEQLKGSTSSLGNILKGLLYANQ